MALPYHRGRIVGILALLLVMVLPITPQFETQAATDLVLGADAEVADAQGDQVNLRDQPSYAGNVLTSVPEGWLVNVLDGPFTDDADGTFWYQVIANGQTGYMLADYLRAPGSEAVIPAAAMTTTANLNLRSGPGATFSVLLVIPNGATVNSTGAVQNGFAEISYNGTTGWSAKQYLSGGSDVSSNALTTANLNLRSGPATSFGVLLVIPNGSTVTIDGALQNGFYPVEFNGTSGFASANYLQLTTSQTATVVDGALNLRSGPGTNFSVLLVMPNGATVTITGAQQNGFYPLIYNGTAGFAAAEFLQIGSSPPTPPPVVDTPGWTTANLNLRSGPSTSSSVLIVIPNGAQITITGEQSSGFYPVRYDGVDGFSSATYITLTAPPTPSPSPTPTPPPPVTRAARTLANLNLRTAASTASDVILVIPNGSQILVTGDLTGGFYPVTFGTASGFASADYISFEPVAGGSIVWPVSGGAWEVLQGYNGSSHQNNSSAWQYLYSLDVARQDGQTAGISVFAPVSGKVSWYERASGGITIDMGNGYAFAMFHLTVDRSWEPGDTINQGDLIGTVSPPGGEGFVQVSHIHLTVWQTTDGGNFSRIAVPFTGQNTISGYDFPSDGTAYQWSGFEFNP